MKFASWLICWAALLLNVSAADWQLYRFEGRDYVSLDNLATFYGFPAPPVLPETTTPRPLPPWTLTPVLQLFEPLSEAAPAHSPLFTLAVDAPPTVPAEPFIDDTPPLPRTINLDSGRMQLEVNLNSREVVINGARQWLAFPTRFQEGHLLISRLDLAKVIEPRLRPERITGMGPVTTIVLDPGHGGHDTGAFSKYGAEKNFALDVALRARDLLMQRGYNVAMTRTSDIFIPLEQRPKIAQKTPGTIFVSIHFNASDANREAIGFEIFSMAPRGAPATNDNAAVFNPRYLREEPGNANELPSAALAGAVYHSLLGHVQIVDRGIKHARFAVLRLCTVPAVLIECGFVTNGPESAQIGSPVWRARVAEAIVEGIDGYKELAVNKQAPKLVADYLRAK
jgi:N-acetylmuramoyl-L-alanine amidase